LILDIFAQRAKSHVGKTQVELARVQYQSSRLFRAWTHLERQKGGIGMRGGPGETQMELDRRMLTERAKRLKADLGKYQKQFDTRRRARERSDTLSVSLVGYTNAGKSTLFNALTKARVYAADQLFATLDTTSRRMFVEDLGNVVISDTVGFVRDLPHQLVEAFRATLEETVRADILLHIVDAASPVRQAQQAQVDDVLHEIDAGNVRQIIVMNKIDAVPEWKDLGPRVEYDEAGRLCKVYLSAKTGEGLELLRQAIAEVGRELAQADHSVLSDDPRFAEQP
jgi:GTP-binding protein HflX